MTRPFDDRLLGGSGPRVSPPCLGTIMFGGATTQSDATRIANSARDSRVNFIRTADIATRGASERGVVRAIAAPRDG
jgi:aryl-alcohol dehydrogenase (NADP+)